MLRTHDNWERLVAATLRREELYELFHAPSISSRSSDYTSASPLPDFLSDYSLSSSRVTHNSVDFNDFEVDSVVNVENHQTLRPNLIFVNGKALDLKELFTLQNCQNPPKKLKPGEYWYDKFAGFWGKQGDRATQIISANLDVAGWLKTKASDGDTFVYLNGREITKLEFRLLQFADVQCYRKDMHFWMNDDGSYHEEGRSMVKASIWGQPGVKLICSLFALPYPPKSSYASGDLSVKEDFVKETIVKEDIKQGDIKKFLLIGCKGSGTRTIFMQAKFLYEDIPLMEDELEVIKSSMRSNILRYISMLLGNGQGFMGYTDQDDEKSIYSNGPGLRAFSNWLLHIPELDSSDFSSNSLVKVYALLVENLWSDLAFQETIKRTKELGRLPIEANYFLERAVEIFRPNYKPSHMDILHAGGLPSTFSYMDFSFSRKLYDDTDSENQQGFTQKEILLITLPYPLREQSRTAIGFWLYRLIRSPLRGLEESHEWLDMSKGGDVVIFSLALSDYDQLDDDDNGAQVNKMLLNIKYFESVVSHPSFDQTHVLLLLTKYDLFEEKIERSPLSQCDWFDGFYPIMSRNGDRVVGNLGKMGFSYISDKFKSLYTSLTGRDLYVRHVNNLEEASVDAAFRYAKEILKW